MKILLKSCFAAAVLMASSSTISAAPQSGKPQKVEISKTASGYTFKRNGLPYFVKGAGGTSQTEKLKAAGGNSFRTWGTDNGAAHLDRAEQLGLTVTMGLDVARERHGFNYDDPAAVKKQLEKLRKEVQKYKDHPALLAWGIGNELNLDYKNPKVWDAVNDIAKMIHEEDPNHPATTMLAGINQKEIDHIKAKCPALDFLSVQVYGGLAKVPQQLQTTGWNGPYLVTEWGPTGHWECPKTSWGAPVEETSTEKAEVYKTRYEASILKDKNCLGSYVFLWGQKQERTPTWYGLFTEAGETSEVFDVMQYEWSGKWPQNRAPNISSLKIDGKSARSSIHLNPQEKYLIALSASDPDNDKLTVRWELLPEATDLGQGGDRESRPVAIPDMVTSTSLTNAMLTVPTKLGAYRLFVYVSDGHNHVATANIPFFVE
ncbi:glycoside hydrolase family 2 TIM barrel-domain containing protein [Pedobacter ginsengisoli]|uniref:glycoside hydrolase family 2 TIM barrel-domain containing protein n=1 Tax=Pedobacter ginsengisoli TaxID=363852 RepID=UPI00254A0C0B|nr:glycoside hydrolase family 2 TIM barrel-domain containing protein [Pedobacter ginsengisoli]